MNEILSSVPIDKCYEIDSSVINKRIVSRTHRSVSGIERNVFKNNSPVRMEQDVDREDAIRELIVRTDPIAFGVPIRPIHFH